MGDEVTRRLSMIVAADVAGYSRLMGADEEGTVAALKLCRETLVDPAIAEGGGRIVSVAGDGLLIEFANVAAALRCCIAIQHEMAARYLDVPLERRLRFRMGINIVDVIVDGMDVFGDGVNSAARLEGVADPGGICVSRAVVDQAEAMADVYSATLGERSLKNIDRPIETYRIANVGDPEASGEVSATDGLPVVELPNGRLWRSSRFATWVATRSRPISPLELRWASRSAWCSCRAFSSSMPVMTTIIGTGRSTRRRH